MLSAKRSLKVLIADLRLYRALPLMMFLHLSVTNSESRMVQIFSVYKSLMELLIILTAAASKKFRVASI